MAEYLPSFKPGQAFTRVAAANVTGGLLLSVGASGVQHAAADTEAWVGVAGFDASTGQDVTVYTGGVQRLTASAAIAAGAVVEASGSGKVATAATPTAGSLVGVALEAAAGDGSLLDVLMYR